MIINLKHMKKVVKVILIVSISLLFIQETIAQEGWGKTQKNDALIYIPSGIERGTTFRVSISKPVKLNGANFKKWFLNEAKTQQTALGKALQKWVIKPDKNRGWRVSNTFVSTNGEKMKVGYQGALLKDGNAYIVQVIFGTNDLTASMKYAALLDKVFQDAEDTFGNSSSLTTVTKSTIKKQTVSPEPTKAIRPDFKALQSIADIKAIAAISWFGYNVFSKNHELKIRNIVVFNDGSFSKDQHTILTEGVIFSKQNNPKKWGQYRIKNKKLEIKYSDNKSFKKMAYYTFYSSLSKNKRIEGCWDVTKTFEYSNGIATNSGMAMNGWCFDKNGRFSKNNTFGFNGGIENSPYGKAHNLPVLRHTSYSDSSKLGWYQINGNIIQRCHLL